MPNPAVLGLNIFPDITPGPEYWPGEGVPPPNANAAAEIQTLISSGQSTTGNGFTLTWNTVLVAAEQLNGLVYLTLTCCDPVVFQVTVTVLCVVPPPEVIVPPGETFQI